MVLYAVNSLLQLKFFWFRSVSVSLLSAGFRKIIQHLGIICIGEDECSGRRHVALLEDLSLIMSDSVGELIASV